MTQRLFDIVIAGGGMVGASLALALRTYPGSVAVVDRRFAAERPAPLDVRCTAINEGSRRLFAGLGVWPQLREFAAPIGAIHVSDRGHFGAARLCAEDYALSALGHVVENHRLQEVLGEALAAARNITLVDAAVEDVASAGDDALTVVVDGAPLSARLLAVAAGARGTLAQRLGMQSSERAYAQAAVVTNVVVTRPREGIAYERFTEAGPVALLPLQGARYAVVMTVAETLRDALLGCPDRAFLRRLQDAFGWRLGRFTGCGERGAFSLSLTHASHQVAQRRVLIGNAARTLHPVAGQGFNLALRDVAELAGLLHGERGVQDPGAEMLLQAFAERRRVDQRDTVALTDLLVRAFGNRHLPVVVARNLGLLAMDLVPPLRHWFARRTMGLGPGSPMRRLGGAS